MRYFAVIFLFTLISCSTKNREITSTESQVLPKDADSSKTNVSQEIEVSALESMKLKDELDGIDESTTEDSSEKPEDCIFDDNYEGLTTSWLNELNITEYKWHPDLKGAAIPQGEDTVYLSKGGCIHFQFRVELEAIVIDQSMSDSTKIIERALELSLRYKMQHYAKMIQEGNLIKVQNQNSKIWYEIPDDNLNDNLYYTGIEISLSERKMKIAISKYYN